MTGWPFSSGRGGRFPPEWAAGFQWIRWPNSPEYAGYVQGTVILMLRKRSAGDRPGFKQRILPAVRAEVEATDREMLHLNDEVKDKLGEPVFNDSDLQMAGYAAALKVLTAYTSIGGEDVTSFALRPRRGRGDGRRRNRPAGRGDGQQPSRPGGARRGDLACLAGIQRFYLRMLDMETTGASKLDNYQNFAKAFRVRDYAAVMASIKPNAARLKSVTEFKPRDLTDRTEIGPTALGALIIALQAAPGRQEPEVVEGQPAGGLADYLEIGRC